MKVFNYVADGNGIGMYTRSILKSVQRLRDHPDSGRKVPEFDQEHIREVIHAPFRVVYLRDASSVNLVRVWRSERLLLLPDQKDDGINRDLLDQLIRA